jgi:hypothetical protein
MMAAARTPKDQRVIDARMRDIRAQLAQVRFDLPDLPDIEPKTTITRAVKLPAEVTGTLRRARATRKS